MDWSFAVRQWRETLDLKNMFRREKKTRLDNGLEVRSERGKWAKDVQ